MSREPRAPAPGLAAQPPSDWQGWSVLALGAVFAALALVLSVSVLVGSDAMWLVAMGHLVIDYGGVPTGVPFATADSSAWVNVPVLGELVFHLLSRLGVLALPFALVLVDLMALSVLAWGAKDRGATPLATSAVLLVASLGMLPALGIVRSQFLSWLPFALLLLLLRRQQATPDRQIWLAIPLLAVWGNLHGGVLVGVAVTGAYLLFSRLRVSRSTAITVGIACLAALFMTPGHLASGRYYLGVLTNEAASRRDELWSALDPSRPFDLLLGATALILIGAAVARHLSRWEWVVLVGLTVGSVAAARNGPWLLMFLVAPAASSLSQLRRSEASKNPRSSPSRNWAVVAIPLLLVLAMTPLALRSDSFTKDDSLIESTLRLAAGRSVLAPEPLAEDLAAAGGRVWVSNPIDAFSRADQAAYLDVWTAGPRAGEALKAVDVVVVPASSRALTLALATGFSARATIGNMVLLERAR